jgi:hypothetical protein
VSIYDVKILWGQSPWTPLKEEWRAVKGGREGDGREGGREERPVTHVKLNRETEGLLFYWLLTWIYHRVVSMTVVIFIVLAIC